MNRDAARLVAFRLMAGSIYALPRAVSYRAARAGGTVLSLLPTTRRAALRANIAVALGLDPGHRRVLPEVRRAFQHALLNYVDMFLLPRGDTARLVARLPIANLELVFAAVAGGKGVILVSAHYGNFDLVVQWLGVFGLPTLIPVEPIEPPALRAAVLRLRGARDVQLEAANDQTFAHLAATLRAGNIVVLVCDRDIQGTGQPVTMFGRTVALPSAAVLLALRTGAPVLAAFGMRHPDNSISATISGPLPITASGKRHLRADLTRGMEVLAGVLERQIARDPGQWVVQQPIFGTPDTPGGKTRRRAEAGLLRARALAGAALDRLPVRSGPANARAAAEHAGRAVGSTP